VERPIMNTAMTILALLITGCSLLVERYEAGECAIVFPTAKAVEDAVNVFCATNDFSMTRCSPPFLDIRQIEDNRGIEAIAVAYDKGIFELHVDVENLGRQYALGHLPSQCTRLSLKGDVSVEFIDVYPNIEHLILKEAIITNAAQIVVLGEKFPNLRTLSIDAIPPPMDNDSDLRFKDMIVDFSEFSKYKRLELLDYRCFSPFSNLNTLAKISSITNLSVVAMIHSDEYGLGRPPVGAGRLELKFRACEDEDEVSIKTLAEQFKHRHLDISLEGVVPKDVEYLDSVDAKWWDVCLSYEKIAR